MPSRRLISIGKTTMSTNISNSIGRQHLHTPTTLDHQVAKPLTHHINEVGVLSPCVNTHLEDTTPPTLTHLDDGQLSTSILVPPIQLLSFVPTKYATLQSPRLAQKLPSHNNGPFYVNKEYTSKSTQSFYQRS